MHQQVIKMLYAFGRLRERIIKEKQWKRSNGKQYTDLDENIVESKREREREMLLVSFRPRMKINPKIQYSIWRVFFLH